MHDPLVANLYKRIIKIEDGKIIEEQVFNKIDKYSGVSRKGAAFLGSPK